MPKQIRNLALVAALYLAFPAQGQAPDPALLIEEPASRTVWSLYWENDGAYIAPNHNTDRHYTNGARIVASSHTEWAEELANWLPMSPATGDELRTAAFYSAAQLIFTPDHIENPANRNPNDRGYVGWLYFSVGVERASETIADRIDLKVGIIGPSSLAEQAQQAVHKIFDPGREPIGWDEQLSDRFAIDLDVNRRWKIDLDHDYSDYVGIELIPEAGFTIGSVHDHLMAGATLRIGSAFMPDDFGAGRLEAPSTAATFPRGGPIGANENLAWSLYARVEGRAVFRNELLYRVEEEPFFGTFQFGFSLIINKNLTIGYSQTWFSREFKGQEDFDSIGALTIGWSFEY